MFIKLTLHDINNCLDWVGPNPTDLSDSEQRTFEKLLKIQAQQQVARRLREVENPNNG